MITHLNHIGVAVKSLDPIRAMCTSVFQVPIPEPHATDDFNSIWIPLGNSVVEFMEPIVPDGIVATFLAKRGEGIHHLCYEVPDIDAEIERYVAQGLKLVQPGIKKEINPGWRTAFFHPSTTHGVLIELLQVRAP